MDRITPEQRAHAQRTAQFWLLVQAWRILITKEKDAFLASRTLRDGAVGGLEDALRASDDVTRHLAVEELEQLWAVIRAPWAIRDGRACHDEVPRRGPRGAAAQPGRYRWRKAKPRRAGGS